MCVCVCVCVCVLGRREGALLVGIDYPVKVPVIVCRMWCAVCGREGWFYVSKTMNGTKLKMAYVFLFCVTAHQQLINTT